MGCPSGEHLQQRQHRRDGVCPRRSSSANIRLVTFSRTPSGGSPSSTSKWLRRRRREGEVGGGRARTRAAEASRRSQPSAAGERISSKNEPGLADAGLADHGRPAWPRPASVCRRACSRRRNSSAAADEAGSGGAGPRPEGRPGAWRAPGQLEDLDGHGAGPGPRWARAQWPARGPRAMLQRVAREEDRAGLGHLLHAAGQVGGLAHRRVVHVQVAADGPHHDVAGVDSDPDLERYALRALDGRPRSASRSPASAAPREHARTAWSSWARGAPKSAMMPSPITWLTVPSYRWTASIMRSSTGSSSLAPFLGVPVGEQLHGALEVGEENGDLLALPLDGRPAT